MPHTSTGEKPSYLLFGVDLRSPTDAALYPESPVAPTDVRDYREEVVTSSSLARKAAVSAMQNAQKKYKQYYDRCTKSLDYKVGDWILIRFPAEETGSQRKPWYGPYRIVSFTETGVSAVKVYKPGDGTISVHTSRVSRCPPAFPAGSYWYGGKRSGPGRPPQWIDALMEEDAETHESHVSGTRDSTPDNPSRQPNIDQEEGDVGRDDEDPPDPPSVPETGLGRGSRTIHSRPNYYGNLVAT